LFIEFRFILLWLFPFQIVPSAVRRVEMESEPMPSSLAVLQSPKRSPSLLDSLLMLDSDALTSLSAANTPMVATQSGLEELLRLAHGHVDSVVAHFAAEELEAASLDEEGCVIVVTPETKTASFAATVSRIVSGVIRTFRRKARGEAGASLEFVQLNASDVGEARYERLKSGFTRLKHHMESVVEHRELLNCALDQLRAATMTLQDTCSLLTKSSVTPPVDFMANLSESSAAVESVKVDCFTLIKRVWGSSDVLLRRLFLIRKFRAKLAESLPSSSASR